MNNPKNTHVIAIQTQQEILIANNKKSSLPTTFIIKNKQK